MPAYNDKKIKCIQKFNVYSIETRHLHIAHTHRTKGDALIKTARKSN